MIRYCCFFLRETRWIDSKFLLETCMLEYSILRLLAIKSRRNLAIRRVGTMAFIIFIGLVIIKEDELCIFIRPFLDFFDDCGMLLTLAIVCDDLASLLYIVQCLMRCYFVG